MMLREINRVVNGQLDSSDPRVGVLASEIPTGFPVPAWLLNDVDAGYSNRLYSLEILTPPAAGVLRLNKAGVGSFSGAPPGTYTGTQRVEKYDPGRGRVSSVTGPYSILVSEPDAVPTVSGVVVSPSSATGSQQFGAVVNGENNPSQSVNWSVIAAGNYSAGSIDVSGYFTAPAPTAFEQRITITATSAQDQNKSGSATVTIAAVVPVVASILVSPDGAVLETGGVQEYVAVVTGANNPPQDVNWSTTLGTITANGELTAPVTIETQIGVVTAQSVFDSKKQGFVTFIVPASADIVTGIEITPPGAVIPGGATLQFTANVLGGVDPSQGVRWSADIGSVDETGRWTAPSAIPGLQQGALTATSVEDPRVSVSVGLVVLALASGFTPSAARTVRILPGRQAFAVGSHWTLGSAGPVGGKDPNSTIDIPFDWSAWLADIGAAALSKVEFLLGGGLQGEGMVPDTSGGTVLVSGGVPGASTTVTCRITTATTPPRTDDRTVVLQIKEQ